MTLADGMDIGGPRGVSWGGIYCWEGVNRIFIDCFFCYFCSGCIVVWTESF